jgi:hypothetical protein
MTKPRPDLLSTESPKGLEVLQLTTEEIPSSHVYMEAQIFTPDSKRLVLHRSAHAHGSDKDDPEHRYLLCDLEDGCALTPLTVETGATGPSVSPDGQWLYYFVDQTAPGAGRLTLKRVKLDGTGRETLGVLDAPLPKTRFRPSCIYPLSTISSDGQRLAISAFLGDGRTEGVPWGLLVFDLQEGAAKLVLQGQTWCNMHPQYCPSLEPEASHDILIQENHGNLCDARGEIVKLVGGEGADIHLIRDDGTDFRNLPWGRDGNEFCQGHQCWRGRSNRAITSTVTKVPDERQLIEGLAAPFVGHVGRNTPGGTHNDLSRSFLHPDCYHFATDIAGARLITDAGPHNGGGALYLADLPETQGEPLARVTFLLNSRCSWQKGAHIHPFLSPDGATGFFNSDESGILQAYMVRGWQK